MSRTGGKRSRRGARREENGGRRWRRIAIAFNRVTRKEGDRGICRRRKKGAVNRRWRRREGHSGGRHG